MISTGIENKKSVSKNLYLDGEDHGFFLEPKLENCIVSIGGINGENDKEYV